MKWVTKIKIVFSFRRYGVCSSHSFPLSTLSFRVSFIIYPSNVFTSIYVLFLCVWNSLRPPTILSSRTRICCFRYPLSGFCSRHSICIHLCTVGLPSNVLNHEEITFFRPLSFYRTLRIYVGVAMPCITFAWIELRRGKAKRDLFSMHIQLMSLCVCAVWRLENLKSNERIVNSM